MALLSRAPIAPPTSILCPSKWQPNAAAGLLHACRVGTTLPITGRYKTQEGQWRLQTKWGCFISEVGRSGNVIAQEIPTPNYAAHSADTKTPHSIAKKYDHIEHEDELAEGLDSGAAAGAGEFHHHHHDYGDGGGDAGEGGGEGGLEGGGEGGGEGAGEGGSRRPSMASSAASSAKSDLLEKRQAQVDVLTPGNPIWHVPVAIRAVC